jgi:hypothetical protein
MNIADILSMIGGISGAAASASKEGKAQDIETDVSVVLGVVGMLLQRAHDKHAAATATAAATKGLANAMPVSITPVK